MNGGRNFIGRQSQVGPGLVKSRVVPEGSGERAVAPRSALKEAGECRHNGTVQAERGTGRGNARPPHLGRAPGSRRIAPKHGPRAGAPMAMDQAIATERRSSAMVVSGRTLSGPAFPAKGRGEVPCLAPRP